MSAALSLAIAAGLTGSPLLPPARHDVAPERPYQVVFMEDAMLRVACGFRRDDWDLYGCASVELNTIFLLRGMPLARELRILRHEQGHMNGWSHDHER